MRQPANSAPARSRFRRRVLKCVLFAAFTLLVLFPNLPRGLTQIGRTLRPESLLSTNFTGLAEINRRLDRMSQRDRRGLGEPRLVERCILRNVRYASDYDNWGNLEYWPSPAETWEAGREDCDGRAILATAVLRARGYASAQLVVGLDHMWVRVDENEKSPGQPRKLVSILGVDPKFSLPVEKKVGAEHFLALARALLRPQALWETAAFQVRDIPPVRRAVLVVALAALCWHPSRNRVGGLVAVLIALESSLLIDACDPVHPEGAFFAGALLLLGAGLFGAALMEQADPVPSSPRT